MSRQEEFLAEAARLALESVKRDRGGPFGAVVVKDDRIIGRGGNQVIGTNDPTAHAEIVAIRDACRVLGTFSLEGCELYTTGEPCPMCLAAVYWARIEKVYYVFSTRQIAEAGFDDEFIYREIQQPATFRRIKVILQNNLPAEQALDEWRKKEDKILY